MTQSLQDLTSLRDKVAVMQTLQTKQSDMLQQKADSAELRLYVLREHFDIVAKALGESVDTKCEVDALRSLNSNLEVGLSLSTYFNL